MPFVITNNFPLTTYYPKSKWGLKERKNVQTPAKHYPMGNNRVKQINRKNMITFITLILF